MEILMHRLTLIEIRERIGRVISEKADKDSDVISGKRRFSR